MELSSAKEKPLICVVEDDACILELLQFVLMQNSYKTIAFQNGDKAMDYFKNLVSGVHPGEAPNLFLLDQMIPGKSGAILCEYLKNNIPTKNIPVVFLTVKNDEEDILNGFSLGVQDYITKPFSTKILLARIKNVLTQNNATNTSVCEKINCGELIIFPQKFEVYAGSQKVILTQTEFYIVQMLAKFPGRVFSREQIISNIKGTQYIVTERTVDVHINSIRKKLKDNTTNIESIRGVGYRIKL